MLRGIVLGRALFGRKKPDDAKWQTSLANSYTHIGFIEQALGNLVAVKQLLECTYEIFEKRIKVSHTKLALVSSCLSLVEYGLGNIEEAIKRSRWAFLVFIRCDMFDSAQEEVEWLNDHDPEAQVCFNELSAKIKAMDDRQRRPAIRLGNKPVRARCLIKKPNRTLLYIYIRCLILGLTLICLKISFKFLSIEFFSSKGLRVGCSCVSMFLTLPGILPDSMRDFGMGFWGCRRFFCICC